jgi:hypothetical protein
MYLVAFKVDSLHREITGRGAVAGVPRFAATLLADLERSAAGIKTRLPSAAGHKNKQRARIEAGSGVSARARGLRAR